MTRVAVVVGGAQSVWEEIEQAKTLCISAGREIEFYICNDMIALFPESAIGVTLQCHKLDKWLSRRSLNGHKPLMEMWAHKHHVLATNSAVDEGGSVGMFAARIAAIHRRHKHILLCGVPMTKAGGHFVRFRPWDACEMFKQQWRRLVPEMKMTTRSFSGFTAEQLGQPTADFLNA